MSPALWVLVAFAALAGTIVGAVFRNFWVRRAAKMRKRIPTHWPLNPRLVANTEEQRVWAWMNRVFFDHQILLKLPVTRFTIPQAQDQGQHWYKLLSGVYCTFTVCTPSGRVIGCVDVPGRAGLSRGNRQLKLTLLSQCGIAYWVLQSGSLPTLTEIREEFLGPAGTVAKSVADDSAVQATRVRLQTALETQRRQRNKEKLLASVGDSDSSYGASRTNAAHSGYGSGGQDWQQKNSFLGALDSRTGDLR